MNGETLAAMLRDAAHLKGVSVTSFVKRLSPDPNKWLRQLEEAQRPKPITIARIRALSAGEVPPAPLVKITASVPQNIAVNIHEIAKMRGTKAELLIADLLIECLEDA